MKQRLSDKPWISRQLQTICITLPIILVVVAFIVGWTANDRGYPSPACTLPWPYIAFGIIPSGLGFITAFPGLVLFIRRRTWWLVAVQILIVLVTFIVGGIVNFILSWCV